MSLASIGATVYQAVAGVLGPVFSAPLDNTAWAGSNAPATFVRDTVATIPDHEGLIKEVVANEIRFEGARRVENLFTDTTTTLAVSAATTAVNVGVGTFVFSMGSGSGTATFSGTATGSSGTLDADASSRTSETLTITVAGTIIVTASVAILTTIQLEDVTGQSNQNPSEYVSVGVGTGRNIALNSGFTSDTVWGGGHSEWSIANGVATYDSPGNYKQLLQTITGEVQTVEATCVVNSNTLDAITYFGVGSSSADTGDRKAIDAGSTGTFTAIYEVDASDNKIFLRTETPTTGSIEIESYSVVKCDHGANVDAVKYFDTENGNTVSSNVVTEATGSAIAAATLDNARIERAATNNVEYSEDLSDAGWVASNITKSTDGVDLPDGTVGTAETLTASAGNGTLIHSITLGAAVNTFSVYLQRKTGTGDIDITLDNGGTWTTKALTGVGTWDRVEVTGSSAADPDVGVRIVTDTDAIQMWGAQLETGTYSTTYIATSGAAATRNKDEFEYALTPAVNDITIACDWTPREDTNPTKWVLSNYLDASNSSGFYWGGGDAVFRKRVAGSNNDAPKATAVTIGATYRLVGRYSSTTGVDIWVDGSKGTNDNNTDDAGVGTTIGIAAINDVNHATNNVGNVVYYNRALTDAECAAL